MKWIVVFIGLILISVVAWAQTPKFEPAFSDGLHVSGTVTKLMEDSLGFLWIGTTDGLYRYDGRQLFSFKHIKGDSTSIAGNRIHDLDLDLDGNILIGTDRGFSVLNIQYGQFRNYRMDTGEGLDANSKVLAVTIDTKGQIWLGGYSGLFKLDRKTATVEQLDMSLESTSVEFESAVWDLAIDEDDNLWVGLNTGLAIYSPQMERFLTIVNGPFTEDVSLEQASQVFKILTQSDGTTWLSTAYGLWHCRFDSGKISFHHISPKGGYNNSLSGNFVNDFWIDRNDDLWVGTWANGLNLLQYNTQCDEPAIVTPYHRESYPELGLDHDKIMAILEDQTGVIWVATAKRLFKWPKKAQKVDLIGSSPYAFGQAVVTSVLFDETDNLWVGTREGLWFCPSGQESTDSARWYHFPPNNANPNALRNGIIYGLFEDSNGIIWITTYGGLHYLLPEDIGQNPVFHRLTRKDGLSTNFIYSITEIGKNDYWIASYSSLSRMNFDPYQSSADPVFITYESNEKDTTSIANSTCYQVVKDRFGQYWVATYDGLSKIIEDEEHIRFENYANKVADTSSLAHNTVGTLHLDEAGRLWAGTRMGLHLVVQVGADNPVSFIHYGLEDGFSNEVIHSIAEDESGNLWVGSNDGLNCFSPERTGKEQNAVLLTLSTQDGLPSNGFVARAAYSTHNGRVYFGSASGLIALAPNQIPINHYQPPVVLTEIKVNNTPLNELKSTYSAFQTIAVPATLQLSYRENTLELSFAALDYTRPKFNRYRYRLKGFEDGWVDAGTRATATYTKLPPGEYTFHVQGANNDGIWSPRLLKLPISITPPFWRTWWAYVIYGLLATGLVMGIFRWRLKSKLRALQRQAQLASARFKEREMLRRKNAADFHDELGHRMTKISLLLELANRQANGRDTIQPLLTKIRHHTNSLSEGIRDLIWGLDPSKDNLFQTLLRLQEFGDRLFEYTPVRFNTEGIDISLKHILLSLEMKKQLLFLFKEAMNNTLKHAHAKQATFSLHQNGQQYIFTFRDNGKGIDPSTLITNKGYGIGNMQMRAHKLGGILLVDGNPGAGTIIRLNIKLPHMDDQTIDKEWLT